MIRLLKWFRKKIEAVKPESRQLMNWRGNIAGFGNCAECGDSWLWKPCNKTIFYTTSSSMFPLCEQCVSDLSGEAIIEHCVKLWISWREMDGGKIPTAENFPFRHVSRAVSKLKQTGNSYHDNCGCEDCDSYEEYKTHFFKRIKRII